MIMMMMMIENIVCTIFQIFCIVGERTNSFFFHGGGSFIWSVLWYGSMNMDIRFEIWGISPGR